MFTCSHCDAQYMKWQGQCAECGKWGTVGESAEVPKARGIGRDNPRVVPTKSARAVKPVSLIQAAEKPLRRLPVGMPEVDRVLGGGLAGGAVVLLTGDPGIGKSTLVLQLSQALAKAGPVLYASGEESQDQIAQRASRLGVDAAGILFVPETDAATIIATAEAEKPVLLIVDSLQTMQTDIVGGDPGSVGQVKAVGAQLVQYAKSSQIPVIIIGHITKEGAAAGPKALEHLVDVTLHFEGDSSHAYRILRSIKNRFGPSGEVGVFTMGGKGLEEVNNPSEFFLSKRNQSIAGTAVAPVIEGSRVICVEVQALVHSSSFASPRRTCAGYDPNRLQLLLAVLSKHAKEDFGKLDVAVSIAGGLKVRDTAVDLAVAVALVSAKLNRPVPVSSAFFGEVSLSGEIRASVREEEREETLKRLGFGEVYTGVGTGNARQYRHVAELLAGLW